MAAKKKNNSRRPKNKRSGNVRFSTYVFKVLKQVHPELAITSKAMKIMDDFMKDIFNRLTEEAAGLVKVCRKSTLTSQDFQTATRLILPGELAHHAVNEATKAVANFMGSRAADRGTTIARVNRDALFESSRSTATQLQDAAANAGEANIESTETGDRVISIHLEASPSRGRSAARGDDGELATESPDLSALNSKEREEYESATEGSEEEANPTRKRKMIMEQNEVIKKKKSENSCEDDQQALLQNPQLNIEIIDTQSSDVGKLDKMIGSNEALRESTFITVQEPKSADGRIDAQNKPLLFKTLVKEAIVTPIKENHINKNDQECDTAENILICQDAMDSGVHEMESSEAPQISFSLHSTPVFEKKERHKGPKDDSSESALHEDLATNRNIFENEDTALDESCSNITLESSEISPELSSTTNSSITDSASLTNTEETPLIYAKISTTVITTTWSEEK